MGAGQRQVGTPGSGPQVRAQRGKAKAGLAGEVDFLEWSTHGEGAVQTAGVREPWHGLDLGKDLTKVMESAPVRDAPQVKATCMSPINLQCAYVSKEAWGPRAGCCSDVCYTP